MTTARKRSRDARDRVDEVVQGHQLHYSMVQLRLVGLLMLLFVLGRGLLPLLLSVDTAPIERLASLTALSGVLPLLPLGISLYLLGGGRQRLPQEFIPATLLHRALVPLALTCLLLLPAITLHSVISLSQERNEAKEDLEVLQSAHRRLLEDAEQATTAAQIRDLAGRQQIKLPITPGEPADLSRWRLAQAFQLEISKLPSEQPLLKLSPYQLELLSLQRTAGSLLLQLITGGGLLMLHKQSRREMLRHGFSPSIFFRMDPVRRRHTVHRST
jgi:hypothetical protein